MRMFENGQLVGRLVNDAFHGLAVVALVIASGGCGEGRPVLRLPMPEGDSVVVAQDNAPYDRPVSVGGMPLCLTVEGTVTITAVGIHEASGDIRIEAFALRPNPFVRGLDGVGLIYKSLVEIGGGFDPGATQQVDTVCPTETQIADGSAEPLDEFAVQLSWSAGELAGGMGLDVTYSAEGVEQTSVLPYGIWLCLSACPDDLGS